MDQLRLVTIIGIVTALLLSACSGTQTHTNGTESPSLLLADLPHEVKGADERTQEAYRYALIEADLLAEIPCYCGCVAIGHMSNKDCYVTDYDDSGGPQFDLHALGCGICVDITQDAVQLKYEGKSIAAIRQAIDQTYSRYGPPTTPNLR